MHKVYQRFVTRNSRKTFCINLHRTWNITSDLKSWLLLLKLLKHNIAQTSSSPILRSYITTSAEAAAAASSAVKQSHVTSSITDLIASQTHLIILFITRNHNFIIYGTRSVGRLSIDANVSSPSIVHRRQLNSMPSHNRTWASSDKPHTETHIELLLLKNK